jgi:hypothetical protein
VDISWHDTPFGQIWKSALGALKKNYTHRAPKFGGIRGRSEPFLLLKSCTEINVFNKQPISLASFLVTCMLLYLVTWATAPAAPFLSNCYWQYSLKEDRLTVESHKWKAVVWFLLTVRMSGRKRLMWRGICKCTKVGVHKTKGFSHHSTTPVSAHLNLCNFKNWIMLSPHVELVPYPGTFIQNVQSWDKEMF